MLIRTFTDPIISKRSGRAKSMDVLIGGCVIGAMLVGLIVFFIVKSEFSPSSRAPRQEFAEHTGTLTQLGVLGNHDGKVNSIAVAPRGEIAISGGDDRMVRVWNLKSGKATQTLSGHSQKVLSVAIDPTSTHFASGDEDGSIKVWNAASGEEHIQIKAHSGSVRTLQFYSLGHALVSGGSDRTVLISEIQTGRELHRYKGHSAAITTASLSIDGRLVLVGCEDGSISVWKVRDEVSAIRRLDGLGGPVSIVGTSSDGKVLTAISKNGTLGRWDIDQGKQLDAATFAPLPKGVQLEALAGSMGGTRLLFSTPDKMYRSFDFEQNRSDATEKTFSSSISATCFTNDSQFGLLGTENGDVEIWTLPDSGLKEIQNLQALAVTVESRGREHEEYGQHMELAQEAVDKKDAEGAEKEFTIARDLATPGTIEYDVADMGADQSGAYKDKRGQYVSLMEQGRDLMKEGEFSAARRKFESAKKVYPEGQEAQRGIAKCDESEKTRLILNTAKIAADLAFDFQPAGRDLLTLGTDFAWMYDREKVRDFQKNSHSPWFLFSKPEVPEPPMGLHTSPILWNVRMTTDKPISSDNLKIRVKLIRATDSKVMAEQDYPLKKGDVVSPINGKADAPAGGWTSSEYYFRKFLVASVSPEDAKEFGTDELVYEHNSPSAFSLGLLRWKKDEIDLTPQMVHQSELHLVNMAVSGNIGDAFRLDVSGTISPAGPSTLKRIFRRNFKGEQVISPSGMEYDNLTMNFFHMVADNKLPFAAMIYQYESLDATKWNLYEKGQTCHLLKQGGGIRVSINSVTHERKTTRVNWEQISSQNSKYWLPDCGAFNVKAWYGHYDFPDPVEPPAREHLLQKFKR